MLTSIGNRLAIVGGEGRWREENAEVKLSVCYTGTCCAKQSVT